MEQLEPFIGEWSLEASLAPGARGRVTFEWALDRKLLVQRMEIPLAEAPDSLSIIAAGPDGAFMQHYFDSRGVVRLYAMTFSDGLWTLSRDAPDFSPLPFHQRFTGTFGDDGDAIDGRWETSDDGTTWKLDFELAYARINQPPIRAG